MSQLYDAGDVNSVFTGGRCEVMKPVMDKYGRYQDAKCRDITPNYFHLAVGNIMGIHDRGFVVDVDATGAVWNQPTYGYNIVSQEEISATMAMSLFQNTKNADKYIFNSEVSKFIKVKTYFKYVVESLDDGPLVSTGKVERMIRTKVYEYILEVDSEDMIVGGEWFGDSLRDHIDFLWVPQSRPTNETMIAEIKYSEVLKLFDQSIKGRC